MLTLSSLICRKPYKAGVFQLPENMFNARKFTFVASAKLAPHVEAITGCLRHYKKKYKIILLGTDILKTYCKHTFKESVDNKAACRTKPSHSKGTHLYQAMTIPTLKGHSRTCSIYSKVPTGTMQ